MGAIRLHGKKGHADVRAHVGMPTFFPFNLLPHSPRRTTQGNERDPHRT
jgi:hypothetical protein